MSTTPDWLADVLSGAPNHEREVVERYTTGLLELARRQLPERIRRRVDPEDIVQSVYRSFFRRLNAGEFGFDDSHDLWRLLAVMTFRKARNQVKHHSRQQRNSFREVPMLVGDSATNIAEPADPAPGVADVAIMLDYLERLLAEVPDRHRSLVAMRLEGFSAAEIAHRAGVSKRTVLRLFARLQEVAGRLIGVDE